MLGSLLRIFGPPGFASRMLMLWRNISHDRHTQDRFDAEEPREGDRQDRPPRKDRILGRRRDARRRRHSQPEEYRKGFSLVRCRSEQHLEDRPQSRQVFRSYLTRRSAMMLASQNAPTQFLRHRLDPFGMPSYGSQRPTSIWIRAVRLGTELNLVAAARGAVALAVARRGRREFRTQKNS